MHSVSMNVNVSRMRCCRLGASGGEWGQDLLGNTPSSHLTPPHPHGAAAEPRTSAESSVDTET